MFFGKVRGNQKATLDSRPVSASRKFYIPSITITILSKLDYFFTVNFSCLIDDKLFLKLIIAHIQPIRKVFSDLLFEQLNFLFDFQSLP